MAPGTEREMNIEDDPLQLTSSNSVEAPEEYEISIWTIDDADSVRKEMHSLPFHEDSLSQFEEDVQRLIRLLTKPGVKVCIC